MVQPKKWDKINMVDNNNELRNLTVLFEILSEIRNFFKQDLSEMREID